MCPRLRRCIPQYDRICVQECLRKCARNVLVFAPTKSNGSMLHRWMFHPHVCVRAKSWRCVHSNRLCKHLRLRVPLAVDKRLLANKSCCSCDGRRRKCRLRWQLRIAEECFCLAFVLFISFIPQQFSISNPELLKGNTSHIRHNFPGFLWALPRSRSSTASRLGKRKVYKLSNFIAFLSFVAALTWIWHAECPLERHCVRRAALLLPHISSAASNRCHYSQRWNENEFHSINS